MYLKGTNQFVEIIDILRHSVPFLIRRFIFVFSAKTFYILLFKY
jgi:hypothetical protein